MYASSKINFVLEQGDIGVTRILEGASAYILCHGAPTTWSSQIKRTMDRRKVRVVMIKAVNAHRMLPEITILVLLQTAKEKVLPAE